MFDGMGLVPNWHQFDPFLLRKPEHELMREASYIPFNLEI
jgi:hypothetical protein